MRKEVIALTLTTLVYSSSSYSEGLGDALRKATENVRERATETTNRARERVEETRDRARERLEETRDKAIESARKGLDSRSEQLREQKQALKERTEEEYAVRKGNAQEFYQQRLGPIVQEESRKFNEDPQGYTEDLASRVNQGRLKFEDVASDGIAQGFVDIKCKNGKRLGSIIEDELGIKEDYTKMGVKVTVLYLMEHNPTVITRIPMIEDSQGRKYSIDDAQRMGIGALESKAKELQDINTRLAYFSQQGRIEEAAQEVKKFERALTGINTYANSPEYTRLVENRDFKFDSLKRKSISEMNLEEMVDAVIAALDSKFDQEYFKKGIKEGVSAVVQLVYYTIEGGIDMTKKIIKLIEHELKDR